MNWSLLVIFYPSLKLYHLEHCLYSISKQTVKPTESVLLDWNTTYPLMQIKGLLANQFPANTWRVLSRKFDSPNRTIPCQGLNRVIRAATNEIFILCKADHILDWTFCEKVLNAQAGKPNVFSTSWEFQMDYYGHGKHCDDNSADLEPLNWRVNPQNLLANKGGDSHEHKATHADAAGYCTTQSSMRRVRRYDERLTCWGPWQMDLQARMIKAGIKMIVVPEFLMFHMNHPILGGETQNGPGGGRHEQALAGLNQWNKCRRQKL